MKLTDADVVWTPGDPSNVRVERHGSGWKRTQGDRWSHAHDFAGRDGTADAQKLAMFVLFNTLVVRDSMDVHATHKAFLLIDEYRETIPRDTPGADDN